jgi:hypothetical protein
MDARSRRRPLFPPSSACLLPISSQGSESSSRAADRTPPRADSMDNSSERPSSARCMAPSGPSLRSSYHPHRTPPNLMHSSSNFSICKVQTGTGRPNLATTWGSCNFAAARRASLCRSSRTSPACRRASTRLLSLAGSVSGRRGLLVKEPNIYHGISGNALALVGQERE